MMWKFLIQQIIYRKGMYHDENNSAGMHVLILFYMYI